MSVPLSTAPSLHRATMARTSPLTFWACWVTVSSIGAALGLVCGLFLAYALVVLLASLMPHLAPSVAGWLDAPLFLLAAAIPGLTIGSVVGSLQASVLPWPAEARQQWRLRSMVGWALGAPLGALVSAGLLTIAQQADITETVGYSLYLPLVLVTAIVVGFTVGMAVRPVLPPPAPHAAVWLLVNTVATSSGWIIAWLLGNSSMIFGLSWEGLALGPLAYAMVTGAMMLWLERRRVSPTTANGHTPA